MKVVALGLAGLLFVGSALADGPTLDVGGSGGGAGVGTASKDGVAGDTTILPPSKVSSASMGTQRPVIPATSDITVQRGQGQVNPVYDYGSIKDAAFSSAEYGKLASQINSVGALSNISLQLADPSIATGSAITASQARENSDLIMQSRNQLFQALPLFGGNAQAIMTKYLNCESELLAQNQNAYDVVRICMKQVSAPVPDASAAAPAPGTSGDAEKALQAAADNVATLDAAKIPTQFQCKYQDFSSTKMAVDNESDCQKVGDVVGKRSSMYLSLAEGANTDPAAPTTPIKYWEKFQQFIGDRCTVVSPKGQCFFDIPPTDTQVDFKYKKSVFDNLVSLMNLKCKKDKGDTTAERVKLTANGIFPKTTYDNGTIRVDGAGNFWISEWVNDAWLQQLSFTGFKFGSMAGDILYNAITKKMQMAPSKDFTAAYSECDTAFEPLMQGYDAIQKEFNEMSDDSVALMPEEKVVLMTGTQLIGAGRLLGAARRFLLVINNMPSQIDGAKTVLQSEKEKLQDVLARRLQSVGLLQNTQDSTYIDAALASSVTDVSDYLKKLMTAQSGATGFGATSLKSTLEAKRDQDLTLP